MLNWPCSLHHLISSKVLVDTNQMENDVITLHNPQAHQNQNEWIYWENQQQQSAAIAVNWYVQNQHIHAIWLAMNV